MRALMVFLTLTVAFAAPRNWLPCQIKYGERVALPQPNQINVGHRGLGSMIADGMKNKKMWVYVVDGGAQFYAIESKSSLDVDIDQPTKYERKGDKFYVLDRNGKERTLKLIRQMSRAEAEAMAKP